MSAEPTSEPDDRDGFDPGQRPSRPLVTTVGVVMAWIGGIVLVFSAYTLLQIDVTSSRFADDVSLADRQSQVQGYHGAAMFMLLWSSVLILAAIFTFVGYRWAATVILVQAGFTVLYLLQSVFGGFALEGVTVTVWSIGSATSCRTRPESREWFAGMQRARAFTRQAG